MVRVALTGGIGTGKSYVLERFRSLGAACIEADRLAHGVMASGTEASRAIAGRFGAGVLDGDGAVDRQKLAPIVFSDDRARRDLEAIVHPAVWRSIEVSLRALERTGAEVAVIEIPLLYETGHAGNFDRVVTTVCPSEVQIARLMGRGLSREEAEQRIAAQLPDREKSARADYVIQTGGTFGETDRQVDDIWRRLR
jgi:dephospho-CoA kinase